MSKPATVCGKGVTPMGNALQSQGDTQGKEHDEMVAGQDCRTAPSYTTDLTLVRVSRTTISQCRSVHHEVQSTGDGHGEKRKRKARAGGTGEMVKSSSQKKEMDFMSAMWMIRIGKCHIASVLFAQQSA